LGLVYWGIGGLAVVTAIGTYERSALVGLVVLGGCMWLRSKHKLRLGGLLALMACLLIYWQSGAWNARVSTIGDYRGDSSAVVRLLVWKWTIDFAALHPFGGGFMSFLTNHIELPGTAAIQGKIEFARAFHSIYFELLGEQGYPGLMLFVLLAVSTLVMLRRLARKTRRLPELLWMAAMADALQNSLLVFLSCGAFVGIAFQPMFWYFVSMAICLNAYLWHAEHQVSPVQPGWRTPEVCRPDWRKRPAPETASLR
jgi:probable O-glycosylation ligase (exosortase A-associated)